jgi:hypothetical protein
LDPNTCFHVRYESLHWRTAHGRYGALPLDLWIAHFHLGGRECLLPRYSLLDYLLAGHGVWGVLESMPGVVFFLFTLKKLREMPIRPLLVGILDPHLEILLMNCFLGFSWISWDVLIRKEFLSPSLPGIS